jgi:hypothetical protein
VGHEASMAFAAAMTFALVWSCASFGDPAILCLISTALLMQLEFNGHRRLTHSAVEKMTNGDESKKPCTAVQASNVAAIESFMVLTSSKLGVVGCGQIELLLQVAIEVGSNRTGGTYTRVLRASAAMRHQNFFRLWEAPVTPARCDSVSKQSQADSD